jgi:hypothetical protein
MEISDQAGESDVSKENYFCKEISIGLRFQRPDCPNSAAKK